MDKEQVMAELDALAKGITHDAAEFLKLTGTASALLPIDGTDRYVAIGTLAMIGKVMPGAAPTVHSTTAAENRIASLEAQLAECAALAKQWAGAAGAADGRAFKARAAALEEAAAVCDECHHTWRWGNEPDSNSGPRDCAAAIRALAGQQVAQGEKGSE